MWRVVRSNGVVPCGRGRVGHSYWGQISMSFPLPDPRPPSTGSDARSSRRVVSRGVVRRDRPHRPDGQGAATHLRQAHPAAHHGVSEGRHPLRGGWRLQRDLHRHPARGHPLTALGQHRPVCPCSTSTSHASGKRSVRAGHAPSIAALADPPIASSATRTYVDVHIGRLWGLHLTGPTCSASCSPGPVRGRAFQAGRVPSSLDVSWVGQGSGVGAGGRWGWPVEARWWGGRRRWGRR